ncbi:MAG TPA: hypothetical protein PKW73_00390 [Candidatus Obscuribacter sp.]|nr:hypothetical protein [Candidatus Obscuribacter sp.]
MYMPRFQITLVLLLVSFLQSSNLSFASTEGAVASSVKEIEKPFSANWPAERPPGESLPVFRSYNCGGGSRPPLYFAYWIHSYFEPKNLSEKAKAQFRLEIKTKEWKNWYKLATANCTPADIFYIEQVIWEASPFACTNGATSSGKWSLSHKGVEFITAQQRLEKKVKPLYEPTVAGSPKNDVLGRIKSGEGLCNNFSCETLYRNEHPDVTKEIAVVHFVPLSAAQCFPTAIEQNELHSLKNLKALEIDKCNSAQLDSFRDEWTQFLKKPANTMSRQMVLKEADRLAAKYHSLFLN